MLKAYIALVLFSVAHILISQTVEQIPSALSSISELGSQLRGLALENHSEIPHATKLLANR